MTTLADLFAADLPPGHRAAGLKVTGLAADSRKVTPGNAFVAVPGTNADGLAYAPAAVAKGAVAVIAAQAPPGDLGVPVIVVADVRGALARAAARRHPRQPATQVAVTGTSGKTSVTAFTRQIWTALGHKAASVGTIGVVAPSGADYGSLTTPDPLTLHATLDRLAGEGVTHLAIEASSHGLDQRRLDGMRFSAGAFLNLSRDHLDYHLTLDAYFASKLRLFEALLPPGAGVVVDADLPEADRVRAVARPRGLRVFSIGRGGAGIRLVSAAVEGFAQRLEVETGGRFYSVRLPLAGAFQVANALAAAGLAIVTGSEPGAVFAALEHLEGAKGRLEKVAEVDGALVFVDYAHKPDGLEKVLATLRPYATGRLVVLIGAGGDRDPGKRRMMGEVAARLADAVIVTDDNPRSEDPALIRRAILEGAPGAEEIAGRHAAIAQAVAGLRPGDVLVVAGKGHETGQIIGDRVLPFSDHDEVAAAVAARRG
ncbi:UDP-N-acetylmuramoyl-L-alanyl-D-glutamate--2,6-diaminopimelate ligase [Blastochloris sulfoviridis]|uniref:UDP-N-acetylmuramoyl-L-alanyl-D-glutamate--2,6-diaminopimelate ligase n=1 Tax=Blastochloris sulfoviridis TaxID=50712 RepID=A0A5M6HQY1_9HYPH|nr:UDP-N-acetylmuramoyl-L-alanyl-D-glutamate--2,6-diaminopimelate ligase [Blastochloris sulfoviridis]KAA5598098.1 UDP-N-acetylmuramoyl-L-alanyl-D-glutamate--2,6-diaminopimelate ligase [Blastochloris sulfoviridis]